MDIAFFKIFISIKICMARLPIYFLINYISTSNTHSVDFDNDSIKKYKQNPRCHLKRTKPNLEKILNQMNEEISNQMDEENMETNPHNTALMDKKQKESLLSDYSILDSETSPCQFFILEGEKEVVIKTSKKFYRKKNKKEKILFVK